MKKQISILLVFSLMLGLPAGCTAPADSQTETMETTLPPAAEAAAEIKLRKAARATIPSAGSIPMPLAM